MEAGFVYSSVIEGITITTATMPQDMFELTAPSDGMCILLGVRIGGQSPDVGDAEAEVLPVFLTKYATGGSGGTAAIAMQAHRNGAPASGSVVDRNNDTQGGTPLVVHADSWNVQAGWLYLPLPDERHEIGASEIIAVELPVDVGDDLTINATITWREVGGF